MSDDTLLDSNNVCAAEDAFEQFQAVSMYQEDEFITLADIAPTKQEQAGDFGELSQIPYDNEVVLTTTDEPQELSNVSSIVETVPTTNPESDTAPSVSKDNSFAKESNENVVPPAFPKKRGRKKKNTVENNTKLEHDTNSVQSVLNSNNTAGGNCAPVMKRARGRPKKSVNLNDTSTDLPDTSQIKSVSESSLTSTNDPENATPEVLGKRSGRPPPKRRGRPRSQVSNDPLPAADSTTSFDNVLSSEISGSENDNMLDDNLLNVRIPKRRRTKKASSKLVNQNDIAESNNKMDQSSIVDSLNPQNKQSPKKKLKLNQAQDQIKEVQDSGTINTPELTSNLNEDLDEICLSQLKKNCDISNSDMSTNEHAIAESNFDSVPNNVSEVSSVSKIPKKGGRKGRSKKVPVQIPLDSVEEIKRVEEDDDLCLSKLKETIEPNTSSEDHSITNNTNLDTPTKRNTKMPIMSDFEYNIDSIVGNENKEVEINEIDPEQSLLTEDTSKRPVRRKIKQTLHYDEGSDEDPFANVELSDDEPRKYRKGHKYDSDDEYYPGTKKGKSITESSSDSEIDKGVNELISQKKRKGRQKHDGQSPRKRGKKGDTDINPDKQPDDIEEVLQSSVITAGDDLNKQLQSWGTTNEFENFLAKKIHGTDLKIKKYSKSSTTNITPLEIPVLEPQKKQTIEMCCQTNLITTASTSAQTSAVYDIPMKENIALTKEQSENACAFLNGIVQTTAELGQLMTQKSQDFIKKKIHTEHVVDTFKMDYCVRKSFLLFKLAKHNLMQMEEDLAKQYEKFLQSNNLSSCREKPKELAPTGKQDNSDSDCEIVEESGPSKETSKTPKFNPKTVFLNKELSIKIAKKPSAQGSTQGPQKKIDIRGRHTVWINDMVMVKKVKPTQSFLAQDSRNKKPPDNYVTTEMVSEFFKNYYRQKALSVCSPFTSIEWRNVSKECVCNYFVVKSIEMNTAANFSANDGYDVTNIAGSASVTNNINGVKPVAKVFTSPEPLSTLCIWTLNNHLHKMSNYIKEDIHNKSNNLTDENEQPLMLFRLCLRALTDDLVYRLYAQKDKKNITCYSTPKTVPTLKTLCYQSILDLGFKSIMTTKPEKYEQTDLITCRSFVKESKLPTLNHSKSGFKSLFSLCVEVLQNRLYYNYKVSGPLAPQDALGYKQRDSMECRNVEKESKLPTLNHSKTGIKSLFSLCVELIQNRPYYDYKTCGLLTTPDTLKHIALEHIKSMLYENRKHNIQSRNRDVETSNMNPIDDEVPIGGLTINSINTLSEEAFFNLEQLPNSPGNCDYDDDFNNDDSNTYDDSNCAADFNGYDENNSHETNWVSQVQMQELRSGLSDFNSVVDSELNNSLVIAQVKIEPLDDPFESEVDRTLVKTEPGPSLDEITIIPDNNNIIKPEIDSASLRTLERHSSSSYDVDAFENFVRSSKLMNNIEDSELNADIFSQSMLRVRRQHEPDIYDTHDADMGLLIPQTYEPINIENAKGSLMESSSDESNKPKKAIGKKKPEKRKGKPTKKSSIKTVPPSNKETEPINEVASLTRRMRDRIRLEEKNHESTDSENEDLPLVLKNKKENGDKFKKTLSKNNISEIQCSNVDSTENITDNITEKFTGFTAIDLNETTSYQKFVKYVYDKIVPNDDDIADNIEPDMAPHDKGEGEEEIVNSHSPVYDCNEPVELLECEPEVPMFEHSDEIQKHKKITRKVKNLQEAKNVQKAKNVQEVLNVQVATHVQESKKVQEAKIFNFVERHGWECYPVDTDDTKLYQKAEILLEKLPESFVETYFHYQNITHKDKEDAEVDRLANLNTLNRSANVKDCKTIGRPKRACKSDRTSGQNSEIRSRSSSRTLTDPGEELELSEDEGVKPDNELHPLAPRHTENTLAKSSLMNDNDSDEGGSTIKQEVDDNTTRHRACKNKPKGSPNKVENLDSLMLTADKVMNKELSLLHAPVLMNDDADDFTDRKPFTRSKKKSASKNRSLKGYIKSEEDSSSEEEKQWVNTKEKLLKRLGKKEDASADDAKRAKLVSEFIERRGGDHELHKRNRGKYGRSKKKFLERQKQFKVLSRELYGETSVDPSHNKRSAQAYFKGRRNIRKVIDKKSLARSTVIANMEEFERKRRLTARQTRLRELLGCEEGVNVLVINDEVCLEYDFEEHRPIVTIHPFFTKVMKAHQYEGVKFMWDACFESLSVMEAGHPGGGCILAHCMGLGKTLQVLALLHTVLTHPRVGMRRVLVCCPLSTVLNWVDEIHKWIGPVTNAIKVFELSKLKKTYERAYQLEDWYSGGGIFIIGYELFRSLSTLDPFLDDIRPTIVNKIRTALLDPGPDIIVCDEGHLLKNDCSVLAVAMSRVATKRRIVLTGTPMQNNLREYYCMVDFVKPNLLGTYSEYSNRFENPIMNGQHRDSREEDIKLMKARTHILHKVLEGCLQRQEASVLYPYLPKKHEYTVFIPLTKCQWDMYKHYLTHYGKLAKHGILKDFHILHKIWSHPQVLHNFQTKARDERLKRERLEDDLANEDQEEIKPNETEVWWLQYLEGGKMLESLESSNKFMVVFQILDECMALGDRMLIFSTSLFCLDGLEYFLKKINKWRLGQEYFRLDGSVPVEVRQKWCREFNADNNEKTKVFLVSTRAGCLGLNMTAANRVIILDTSWNPAHDIQSIFRVYRFGQKKDCYIYRLVAMGTMEQKIYERSVTKQAVACRVVDEQQIDRHYNSADLTELYKYDEFGASVAGGVAVSVKDVVLLRVARCVALHAVHEHDSLLRGSEPALPEHERAAAWNQFQQEQEDKHVQNQLTVKKIPIKKIPSKPIHGHEYAKAPPISTNVIKQEEESITKPGPKSKKGKRGITRFIAIEKNTIQTQLVDSESTHSGNEEPTEILGTTNEPPGASTSNNIPSVQIIGSKAPSEVIGEDDMVQKITDILIKHDFQNKKTDVGLLIRQVRQIVLNKDPTVINTGLSDELSRSIAQVLLGERSGPIKTIVEINSSKKDRTRRKAAEKAVSIISEEVINIDDDDDNDIGERGEFADTGDTEYVPEPDEFVEPTKRTTAKKHKAKIDPPKEPENKTKEVTVKRIDPNKPETSKKPIDKNIEQTNEIDQSDSILLSDDEETVPSKGAVGTDDAMPLPLSLLTNKNFIKIVALTYASGNPMLDEDAATLAAQYSTSRALKESEQSGKAIVSGPIYEIAIKVLGADVLKKLNTANDQLKKTFGNTATSQMKDNIRALQESAIEANTPRTLVVEPISKVVRQELPNTVLPNTVLPKSVLPKSVLPKSVLPKTVLPKTVLPKTVLPKSVPPVITKTSSTSPVVSTANTVNDDVVPVGLIKRGPVFSAAQPYRYSDTQPTPPSRDECILPDDDCIVPDQPMAKPQPPNPNSPKPPFKSLKTSKTVSDSTANKQILNYYIKDTTKPSLLPSQSERPTAPTIQISSGRVVMPAGNATSATPTTTSQNKDTICLDSDDDETPNPVMVDGGHGPTPVQMVVSSEGAKPVAVIPIQSGAHIPLTLKADAFTQPMVLQNKLPSGSSKRKFVLVPKSQVPPAILQGMKETPKATTGQSLIKNSVQATSTGNTVAKPIIITKNANKATESIGPGQKGQSVSRPSAQTPARTQPVVTAKEKISAGAILKNTKCSPGDVLRISKTGQITLLSKDKGGGGETISLVTDIPKTTTTPPTVSPASRLPAPSTSKTIAPKFRPIAPKLRQTTSTSQLTAPQKPTPQKVAEIRSRIVSTSSSSSSRSSSPDNPLSILKDVVHIQAADDLPIGNKKKTDTKNEKYLAKQTSVPKQIISLSKALSLGDSKNTSVIDITDGGSHSQKANKVTSGGGPSKVTPYNEERKEACNNLIKKLEDKSKAKLPLQRGATKVTGVGKSIILDGVNKGVSLNTKSASVDLTGSRSAQVINIKKIPAASSQNSNAEAKKRSAPVSDSSLSIKKKKPPLTLKDFDIDDIDDIIELD